MGQRPVRDELRKARLREDLMTESRREEALNEFCDRLIRFAEALGGLPAETLLSTLHSRSLLHPGERLDALLARRLIEACPDPALAKDDRKRSWQQFRESGFGPGWEERFEPLRAGVEGDLRSGGGAAYAFSPGALEALNLSAVLAMKAVAISAIFHDYESRGERREAMAALLRPYLPESAPLDKASLKASVRLTNSNNDPAPRVEAELRIMSLDRRVDVGSTLPLEAYLSRGGKTYNVSKRTRFSMDPLGLASLEENRLLARAPGELKVFADYEGLRGELTIQVQLPVASRDGAEQDRILTRRRESLAAFAAPLPQPQRQAEAVTQHQPTSDEDFCNATTRTGRLLPEDPENESAGGSGEDSVATLIVPSAPRTGHLSRAPSSTSLSKPELAETLRTGPSPLISAAPRATARVESPPFEQAAGPQTARFLGGAALHEETVRFGTAPLVLGLIAMFPAGIGEEMNLRFDGHAALKVGRVCVQHLLLQPGLKLFELVLEHRNQSVLRTRLAAEWRLPDLRPEAGAAEPPALCLELMLRYEGLSAPRARLRCLAPSPFVSLTRVGQREPLAMVRKPGDSWCASVDLETQGIELMALGRQGDHFLSLLIQS